MRTCSILEQTSWAPRVPRRCRFRSRGCRDFPTIPFSVGHERKSAGCRAAHLRANDYRRSEGTVNDARLNGRLRVWRSRGGVAASPEEWLVRLSSASRRGGPVDDEGADDVGVAYAND